MFENINADLARLTPDGKRSWRGLISGLLSQGFQAILVYRLFHWLHQRGISGQPLRFLAERFIEITTGISIPACCRIGKGFRIHHFGGIIFHPTAEIGDNCTIYHGVTIGDRGGSGNAARIGNNVLIGAGAKIIGEITVEDNCVIGANTVVTKDVPENSVAVGSPCTVLERKAPVVSQTSGQNTPSRRPRIMDLRGTYKGGGGPDKTILNSAAQHDPEKVYILVTYLRQPGDHEFGITATAGRLGIRYAEVIDGGTVDAGCLKKLKRLIEEHGLQVVHAHDDKTLLYGWLLKLMVAGLKIMYTCHSHAISAGDGNAGFKEQLKFTLRQRMQIFLMQRYGKPILTVSNDTKERLVTNGIPAEHIDVLANGIDLDVWRPEKGAPLLRAELGVRDDEFLIGTVARITPDKDLPTFYRVAERVSQRLNNVVFAIVGDGLNDELKRAEEEVAQRGLSRLVRFTGHRNDLPDVYRSFDIFLMTSVSEGMPNTLLEAMALGVPSVATAVGGVPEVLVHGSGGLLAPSGNAEELALHVCTLLADEHLRNLYRSLCRERIETHFSFSRRVRRLEDYYARFAFGSVPKATKL